MTQHNAALVEETNAVIEQTESQTQALDMLVDIFIVEADTSQSEKAMRRVA
jgi:methyl-accepting chemotaxis protein